MTDWFNAACNGGNGVDVRRFDDGWQVRDSKDPDGPVLTYTHNQWTVIRADAVLLDRPRCVAQLGVGMYAWVGLDEDRDGVVVLRFTAGEVRAFVQGVRSGEFETAKVPTGYREVATVDSG